MPEPMARELLDPELPDPERLDDSAELPHMVIGSLIDENEELVRIAAPITTPSQKCWRWRSAMVWNELASSATNNSWIDADSGRSDAA